MLPSPCERVWSTYRCGWVWSKALFSVDWLYQPSLEVGSGSTNYLWKFCDLQRLVVAVPTVCGGSVTCRGWQCLYQLSVEVLWPAEVDSGCTNCLLRFCDLQRLAVPVPTVCRGWQWHYQLSVEVLWPAEVGSACTNCLWKFCDQQRLAVTVPTVSGGSVTCRGWQLFYRLSLELLLDAQLTIHTPALAQGTK
jgi:hypothetical protein